MLFVIQIGVLIQIPEDPSLGMSFFLVTRQFIGNLKNRTQFLSPPPKPNIEPCPPLLPKSLGSFVYLLSWVSLICLLSAYIVIINWPCILLIIRFFTKGQSIQLLTAISHSKRFLEGLIQLTYLLSKLQLADILTKSLPSHQLHPLLSKLGMINLTPSLRGILNHPLLHVYKILLYNNMKVVTCQHALQLVSSFQYIFWFVSTVCQEFILLSFPRHSFLFLQSKFLYIQLFFCTV